MTRALGVKKRKGGLYVKKKLLSLLLALVMIVALAVPAFAEDVLLIAPAPKALPEVGEGSIVILHTNDIHTYIDGDVRYSDLAALKAYYESLGAIVILVDAGDHIQGTAYGSMDKGKTIIDLMNATGYDVATLGNHEFDYGMEGRIKVTDEWAEFPYVSCNFYHEADGVPGESVLKPYELVDLGFLKIAFVGITTPESFTKSTPAYFQDGNGNYIYGIAGGEDGSALYAAVQTALDAAVAEADIVVGLAHLGDDPASQPWTSEEVIANTTGFDIVIDGHSHSTVVGKEVTDKEGNTVTLSQTGEYLGGIGVLMPQQDHTTDAYLLSAEDIAKYELTRDAEVEAIENAWIDAINTQLGTVIGSTEDVLDNYDADGNRLVRSQETNVGDFCADALYYLFDNMGLDVDVAIMNGGGIRNKTPITGELSYLTMKEIHTFGNVACLQTITGQQLLDALEWGAKNAGSGENGGFLHVSGIKYTINTAIPSTVQADEKGVWIGGPTGAYRVSDVQILQDGEYVALDLNAKYNLAGYNYTLRDLGDGFAMFGGAVNVLDYVMEDYMVLANYVQSFEGGKVTGYDEPQGRISIVNTYGVTEMTVAGNTVYVYAPESELLVSSTCTAPCFIVYGATPYTSVTAKADALESGLGALAAAEGATIVFINPEGETWSEADLDVYPALIDLYSNSSDNVYVNGIAEAVDWMTGATSTKILGDTGRVYIYGIGPGADFAAANLMKKVTASVTYPDGFTMSFDRTPTSVTLIAPSAIPAATEPADISVAVVEGPADAAEKLAGLTDKVLISDEDIATVYKKLSGAYRRQVGILLPVIDWAAEGITETVITRTASVTNFMTGESFEMPYHNVVYYANDLNVNDPANPVPLVLTFHGGGNTALYQAQASEWPLIGKANGFITVAVDNHTALNAGHIVELVEYLKTVYAIDVSRIYASGFSMGSVKSWDLFDNPMFAGVAPMSGSFSAPTGEPAGHIMPVFYVGGEASPLPELVNQDNPNAAPGEPNVGSRIAYTLKANKVSDNYTYDAATNLFWGVNGDLVYQVTDKVAFKDSVLTVNLFASEDGKYYTALASSSNQSHEVYARNSWAAWDFLKQFSRAADGSVIIEDVTYTLTSDDGKVADNSYNEDVVTYTVAKGDSLWKIAKSLYGKGSMWKVLFEANQDTIKNPNRIYVGQVLTVPEK